MVRYSRLEEEENGDAVVTDHGAPTERKNLYIAVGAVLFGPIGIGLTLGYSSGAIESIKEDPHMDWNNSDISWFGSIMTIGAAVGLVLNRLDLFLSTTGTSIRPFSPLIW